MCARPEVIEPSPQSRFGGLIPERGLPERKESGLREALTKGAERILPTVAFCVGGIGHCSRVQYIVDTNTRFEKFRVNFASVSKPVIALGKPPGFRALWVEIPPKARRNAL